MFNRIQEIISYRDMIGSLVKRELRGKYKGSALGFLWTFINPLCQILVYTIVFSIIVRSDLDNFYVYVITGMIPWLFFDSSMRIGSGCIRYQGDMVNKIYFPREVLPLSCVTANFVNMLLCFIIVFIVLFSSGIGFSLDALLCLPLVMAIEYIMVLGFTLFISAVTVYFKDMEHIVTVLLMAWIYMTPILYPITSLPDKISWIFKLNPMTYVIEAYHAILYYKSIPTLRIISYALAAALVILLIGEMIFKKLDKNFAEEL
jgi:ABC-2 type transport system permease protein